jgi:hypothetical protein
MGCLLDEPEEAYASYRLCQRSLIETLRPQPWRVSAGLRPLRFPGKPAKGVEPDGRHGGLRAFRSCECLSQKFAPSIPGPTRRNGSTAQEAGGYRLGGMENACPSKGS